MADLSNIEKRWFERRQVGGGYVLGFLDLTFADFVTDSVGRDIYDPRYAYGSGSKGNLLRRFWKEETNRTVGKLLATWSISRWQRGTRRRATRTLMTIAWI